MSFGNPATFSGHTFFRLLTMSWFSLGITVTLDAGFYDPGALNGWAPGCTSPSECNDGNPCSADSCDPTRGCHHDPVLVWRASMASLAINRGGATPPSRARIP